MSAVMRAKTPAAIAAASARDSRTASRHGRLARTMPRSSRRSPVSTRVVKATPAVALAGLLSRVGEMTVVLAVPGPSSASAATSAVPEMTTV